MDKAPKLSALAEALFEHDAGGVTSLANAGEELHHGETAIQLVAEGLSAASLDQFNRQDVGDIAETLTAARSAGLDLNAPIEARPAALWLTDLYTRIYASHAFDRSVQGLSGVTPDTSMARLKAFAVGGVDFSVRDEDGQGFEAVAHAAIKAYAEQHAPWVTRPGYVPEYDWSHPRIETVQEEMQPDLQDIKRAIQISQITRIAQDRADAVKARSLAVSPRSEPECPF